MRVVFGVLSLLIVLAIVGLLAKNQLDAAGSGERRGAKAAAAATASSLPATGATRDGEAAGGGAADRSPARALPQRLGDDAARALQQGAERNEAVPR